MGRKCLVLAYLFLVALPNLGKMPAADEPKKPPFKKYVGILYKGNPRQVILLNAQLKTLGDRQFVVGTAVRPRLNPGGDGTFLLDEYKEHIRWIALSEIVDFYEFDDAKRFNADFPD